MKTATQKNNHAGRNQKGHVNNNNNTTGFAKREKEAKRIASDERKKKSDNMTPFERIMKLDTKLGQGQGAKKERERLQREYKI